GRDRHHPGPPGRAGGGGGGAGRRVHRRGPARRGRGQRGAAVPADHVLATGPVRLGRAELPRAPSGPIGKPCYSPVTLPWPRGSVERRHRKPRESTTFPHSCV